MCTTGIAYPITISGGVTVKTRIKYNAGDFIGPEGLIYLEEAEPYVSPKGYRKRVVAVLCQCGKRFETQYGHVINSLTVSCGCYNQELRCSRTGEGGSRWKGGVKSHYLYETWCGMIKRCSNVNAKCYSNYGGRGIKVCNEWLDSKVFLDFCDEVLGQRPEGHTLDRIDNDGNYEPGNVRWADAKTQINNRRCSNGSKC